MKLKWPLSAISRWTFFLMTLILIGACSQDNEEELFDVCNTTDVSFMDNVLPILATNCNGCHSTDNAPILGAGIILDTYAGVKGMVDAERLWGTINHLEGFSPMPKGSTETIDQCFLDQIKSWLDAGALDN